jgi:hypothetical protein
LAWGYRHRWSGGATLAGLCLGLSQYFYSGNKISFFLLIYVIALLYRQDPDRRRMVIHLGKMAFTALVVAAPITLFALLQPDLYFLRARMVYGWQPAAIVEAVGDYDLWRYFWFQMGRSFGAYTTVPEITGFYGPGVPFLIGLSAPLFVIGALWTIWQRHWIPALWIATTTIFGGIMLTGAPSSSHFAVVIPAVCWLTAVPLGWLWQRGYWKIAIALLVVVMATDLFFYFGSYVPSGPRDLVNPMPGWPWP